MDFPEIAQIERLSETVLTMLRTSSPGRVPFDAAGGEPLRDGLRRAQPGEPIVLCSFEPFPLPGPFAERGPIYVAAHGGPAEALAPDYFRNTTALRAYSRNQVILEALLLQPVEIDGQVVRWLNKDSIWFVDAHFGAFGCFGCRFVRPGTRTFP